tara:strand:+ start:3762 stop:5279 length:1518 start_codon:yes stop_codon:yes gene_type:complete
MKNIFAILLLLLVTVEVTTAQKKPNFLFILTDDQTYESIHALNNVEVQTPNMDKLVDQGVTFSHCFNQGSWSGAVCVASRSMLITGQNVFKAPQNEVYLDNWALLKGNTTKTEVLLWTEVFKNNGYETFITGKWHNSKYALLKGFDRSQAFGDGFYDTKDENGKPNSAAYNRGSSNSVWKPWDTKFNGQWSPTVNDIVYDENGQKKIGPYYTVNQHTSELYADKAIQFLQDKATVNSKPFFMYVAFNAPHDPRQSPKKYVDMYPPSSIKIPDNYMTEHPFNQGDHKVRDERLAPFPRTKEAVQLHRSEYYAIISHLDYELGRVLKALKNSGQEDNTYVIFTSDHGLAVGQHGLMGKQNQYEHSIRMPLIIKGPGLKPGTKVENKVYMQSMFATTCELASLETPKTVDFKSIKGLLTGDKNGGEEYIFGAYKKFQRMIRSDKFKLIVYPHINIIQLFDIENDPHEKKDLSTVKKFKKIKKKLLKELIQKQKEYRDFILLKEDDYNL